MIGTPFIAKNALFPAFSSKIDVQFIITSKKLNNKMAATRDGHFVRQGGYY